jgi:hypothetical protein
MPRTRPRSVSRLGAGGASSCAPEAVGSKTSIVDGFIVGCSYPKAAVCTSVIQLPSTLDARLLKLSLRLPSR